MEVQTFKNEFNTLKGNGTAVSEIQRIWTQYINEETSTSQICFSDILYDAMKKRILNQDCAKEIFDIMVSNPKLTIERDIYPRFIRSDHFQRMARLLKDPIKLYLDDMDKEIKNPRTIVGTSACPNLSTKEPIQLGITEILDDDFLAAEFLEYLKEKYCHENLSCYLSIQRYKMRHNEPDVPQQELADRCAQVYFRFIQPGCADEISIASSLRHSIGVYLAAEIPPPGVFEQLENTLVTQLNLQNFQGFKQSPRYLCLKKVLLDVQTQQRVGTKSTTCVMM